MQNLAQATVNHTCPVCGMPVDTLLKPIVAVRTDDEGDDIQRIGACSQFCAQLIARAPDHYLRWAVENSVAEPPARDDGERP